MIIKQKQTVKEIFEEKFKDTDNKLDFLFDNLFLYNDYEETKTEEAYEKLKENLQGNRRVQYSDSDNECCGQEMMYDNVECVFICVNCGRMEHHLDLQMTYQDKVNLKPPQYKYNRNKHFMKLLTDYPKDIQDKIMCKFNDVVIAFNEINNEEKKTRNLPCFNYLLYKLLELLELKEYTKDYKLKKSREKLKELDVDWRKVTKRCFWPFWLTI